MVEERRVWRSKTTLVVCIIVIACLVGTNVWAYSENLKLQSQTASLEDKINQLQSLNSTLQAEKSQLQNQIESLQAEKDQLQSQVDSLETEKAQLENQVSSLKTEKTQLENQVSSLQTEINQLQDRVGSLEAEISQLQEEVERLEAPKLVLVNLKSDDVRPWSGTPYLHIYGEICNVGEKTAYDSKLHVVAYRDSNVTIDKYITLGSIEGGSWETVDEKIYYTGSSLGNWTITPEWTD